MCVDKVSRVEHPIPVSSARRRIWVTGASGRECGDIRESELDLRLPIYHTTFPVKMIFCWDDWSSSPETRCLSMDHIELTRQTSSRCRRTPSRCLYRISISREAVCVSYREKQYVSLGVYSVCSTTAPRYGFILVRPLLCVWTN